MAEIDRVTEMLINSLEEDIFLKQQKVEELHHLSRRLERSWNGHGDAPERSSMREDIEILTIYEMADSLSEDIRQDRIKIAALQRGSVSKPLRPRGPRL